MDFDTSRSTWIDYVNQTSIQLHPRLMEYVNRKKYYNKINYVPSVPLEKQYSITKQDIEDIKSFYRGEKPVTTNINDDMKYEKDFPSKHYWDEKKIPYKYPTKYPQPKNMGMFADEIDWTVCKINDRHPIDMRDISFVRSSFKQPDRNNDSCFETNDPDVLLTDSKSRPHNKSVGYRETSEYAFDPGFYYDNQVEKWDVGGINTRSFNKSNQKIYGKNRDVML